MVPGGKFRILERHQWRGMDFRAQAEAIRKLTQQYNVTISALTLPASVTAFTKT
jgi:hypothetical protein